MTNDNRTARYVGRAALHKISDDPRCQECGRRSVLPGGNVELRKTEDGGVGFAGVFTCGKVWLCPVCNSKVMARRALEIGVALAWAQREGLQVIWGALTCRHIKTTPLTQLLSIQRGAWASMSRTKVWRSANATERVAHTTHGDSCPWECNFRADHICGPDAGCEYFCPKVYDTIQKTELDGTFSNGRVGYIKAAELTYGANGFHPHFHPIILYRGDAQEAEWFATDVVNEWVLGVEGQGGEALRDGGQSLKVVKGVEVFEALNGYVTKSTYNYGALALEAVWSQAKTGRGRAKSTASHWTLLAAIAQGLADEAGVWMQIEEAIAGHRMITWSRGLRDFAGLNDEKTDEDVAAEEVGTRDDTVGVITAAGWLVVKDEPLLLGLIMSTLDEHGWEKLCLLLDFYGVEWASVDDLADTDDRSNRGHASAGRDSEYAAQSSW